MPNEDNTTPQSKTGDNNPTVGSKLGDFEIRDRLGTGAMGEVFLAVDSKLGREVALKVLSPSLPYGGDYLKRFENEAKLLASLSHPNVAHLHDFQEQDGAHFLVMELARGESLDRIIKRGPLNPREAIPIFIQVAQALEAAHEVNIIHRDLKPENIMVDRNGTVKVLDFGLAKHVPSAPWSVSEAHKRSGAELNDITTPGMIIGTPSYMSPEQARGNEIDTRTDIWAFGCCFYQALTGKPPFRAANMSDTLANVLTQDPDWGELPASTPIEVERLLRRCLEKELKNRLRHIGDGLHDLQVAQHRETQAMLNPFSWYRKLRGRPRIAFFLQLAGIIIFTVIGASIFWPDQQESVGSLAKFTIPLVPGFSIESRVHSVAISRDGTRLVYIGGNNSTTRLFIREMDEVIPRPLPRTDGALSPFFSPDGEWVIFYSQNSLKKISVRGGMPTTVIADIQGDYGVTWGAENVIVFSPKNSSELKLLHLREGESTEPETLTTIDTEKNEVGHWFPRFLPDGKSLLFTSFIGNFDTPILQAISIDAPQDRKTLLTGVFNARYVPTGHLVYVQDSTLYAVPFDKKALKTTGQPTPILHDVQMEHIGRHALFDISQNGTLVYARSITGPQQSRLVVRNRHRNTSDYLELPSGDYAYPRFSEEGNKLLMHLAEGTERQIHLYDLDKSTSVPVTFPKNAGSNFMAMWFGENEQILFSSDRKVGTNRNKYDSLYSITVGGDEDPSLELRSPSASLIIGSYSKTQNLLAYMQQTDTNREDIYLYDFINEPKPIIATTFREGAPALSPSGQLVAYVSNKTGYYQIHIRRIGDSQDLFPTPIAAGTEPVWSQDGDELFYRYGRRVFAVAFHDTDTPEFGTPEPILEAPYRYEWKFGRNFDVHGDMFVFIEDVNPSKNELAISLNWFDELEDKLSEAGISQQ